MDLTPPQLTSLHEGYKSLTSPPKGGDARASEGAQMSRRKRGESKK